MFANEPSEHVTAGPRVTATLSVAVSVDAAIASGAKVMLAGVKVTTGGVVSLAM